MNEIKKTDVLAGFIVAIITVVLAAGATTAITKIEPYHQPTGTASVGASLNYSVQIVDDSAKPDKYVAPKPKASRSASRTDLTGRGISKSVRFHLGGWHRFPAYVERAAFCVARHEGWRDMWKAQNYEGSGAAGPFQFMPSTWRANAKRAGVKVTRTASLSSPRDQAKVFAWMWMNGGKHAWNGTHCYGADY